MKEAFGVCNTILPLYEDSKGAQIIDLTVLYVTTNLSALSMTSAQVEEACLSGLHHSGFSCGNHK